MALKTLFPPIVPNSLPAFDKAGVMKYYFKPSIANTISQIKHLQMSIVRLDTNRTVLNSNDYPHELIFKNSSEFIEDKAKGFWYVEIPASIFPTSDVPYKVQIRFGELSAANLSSAQQGELLKNLDKMSEWSIVTMVLPITIPDFGIQNFSEATQNKVISTGHVFSGYFEPQDPNRQETLSSFRYNLYSGEPTDKTTWKLLSTSGEKFVGVSNKINLDYTFPYELTENNVFVVTMTIKTKNLYTHTKVYKVYSSYPSLETFNFIRVIPDSKEGKMDIQVGSKQILLKANQGAEVEFILDSINTTKEATHAKIKGTIEVDNNFGFIAKDSKWVCQFKAMFSDVKNSMKEIIDSPTIELCQSPSSVVNSGYYTKLKIGCMKINLAYPTSSNPKPAEEWEYRFVIRKEALVNIGGKETLIAPQTQVFRVGKPINPKQEYYFYIKEEQGDLIVDIRETYLSSNTEI